MNFGLFFLFFLHFCSECPLSLISEHAQYQAEPGGLLPHVSIFFVLSYATVTGWLQRCVRHAGGGGIHLLTKVSVYSPECQTDALTVGQFQRVLQQDRSRPPKTKGLVIMGGNLNYWLMWVQPSPVRINTAAFPVGGMTTRQQPVQALMSTVRLNALSHSLFCTWSDNVPERLGGENPAKLRSIMQITLLLVISEKL